MGNILVVADNFFFQCAIVVAPFFNVVITSFAHVSALLRLNAGSLTMIADAPIVHASCTAASTTGRATANTQFFCSLFSYEFHDMFLLFFFR